MDSLTLGGTRAVARKMAHQNSLNLVRLSNCDFSNSVLEPLDGFKNSATKLGIRLDVQGSPSGTFQLI